MSRRLGGLALLISPVDSVIMVGYIDPAPHEDMAANHNALDRRDVYSIGKRLTESPIAIAGEKCCERYEVTASNQRLRFA